MGYLDSEYTDPVTDITSMRVMDTPLDTTVTTAVTLTTHETAYKLPSTEQVGRKTIEIYNKSDYDVYVGGPTVTIATGMLVAPGESYFKDAASGVYACSTDDGAIINVIENK